MRRAAIAAKKVYTIFINHLKRSRIMPKVKTLTPAEYGQRALIRLLVSRLDSKGYALCRVMTSSGTTYIARASADLAFNLLNSGEHPFIILKFGNPYNLAAQQSVKLMDNEDPVDDWSNDDIRFSKIVGTTNLT